MAGIPQISNPIGNKGYQTSTAANRHSEGSEEYFDIIQIEKPLEAEHTTDRESGGKSDMMASHKDFLQMAVKIAKDPNMAVESMKQILNNDLLAVAKSNGYTELHGELDALMEAIFLSPEQLVDEIIAQEKQNTMFSDNPFFDQLRSLAGTAKALNNEDMKNAIGNMLKAINFTQNREEILTALSSNLKFLSEYFSPNQGLAKDLTLLSDQWGSKDAGKYFELLKSETLSILRNVSESLLNNERTQVLIPLIIHNISRYNTNESMLPEYFSQLMSMIPNQDTKSQLAEAFDNFLQSFISKGEANAHPNNVAGNNIQHNNINNTTFNEINQPQQQGIQANTKTAMQMDDSIIKYLERSADNGMLNEAVYIDSDSVSIPVRSYLLGKTDGKTAIETILKDMLVDPEMKAVLSQEIGQKNDITSLVDYLNDILRSLPEIDERQDLYESLLEIVNTMAEKEELPIEREKFAYQQSEIGQSDKSSTGEKAASLNELVKFVEKNIDHAALKTINNYNASNLLQSLINAPGVFTPLAHYIIPLEVEDTKAFGELWVNNDEETSSDGSVKKSYHLFLTFDVESIGRFEIDMRSMNKDVNISLLHPEGFAERIDPITRKVNRIIAQSGYVTKNFSTGPLKKPHDLTQVFPNITEKRSGFNVTA